MLLPSISAINRSFLAWNTFSESKKKLDMLLLTMGSNMTVLSFWPIWLFNSWAFLANFLLAAVFWIRLCYIWSGFHWKLFKHGYSPTGLILARYLYPIPNQWVWIFKITTYSIMGLVCWRYSKIWKYRYTQSFLSFFIFYGDSSYWSRGIL